MAFFISMNSYVQSQTLNDSIITFYDSLFNDLENKYLFKSKTNWETLKPIIQERALQSKSFKESLRVSTFLFDTIQDDHTQIFYKDLHITNSHNREFTADDFSEQFITRYEAGAGFEAKVIKKEYGYVRIPGILLMNVSQDSLNAKSQQMYDKIIEVDTSTSLKGWIIDLRFNSGGNAYAMIAALYHLLGDTVVYNGLDLNGEVKLIHRLENGNFYAGKKIEATVRARQKPDITIPVTFITGKLTASAGEDILVAFKGRDNISFIGEPTYGFLTGNDKFELPFEAVMAMTTEYIADRNNVYTKNIIPDVVIEKQDNFDDLTKDPNIIEAIKFINSKK
ncbi:S41 family peptidase [Aquimarina sp. 2201CG5-10]|uniref:S41 family peptidase n=1 Tax=Aquimarina callyspongiae TaxID=3098150 RepID=UPI002AC993E8|nr:S41 family peptidase [Aquimarina sp. 2201CG5-10]